MGTPYPRRIHDHTWRNKHKNQSGPVGQLVDVWNLWDDGSSDPVPWKPGIAGLQTLIREAQESNVVIRPLGGNWSLSRPAYSPNLMVNTKPLNLIDVGIVDYTDCHGFDRSVWEDLLGGAQAGFEATGAKAMHVRVLEGGRDEDNSMLVSVRWRA